MSKLVLRYLVTSYGLYEWFQAMAGWADIEVNQFIMVGLAVFVAALWEFGFNPLTGDD